MTDTQEKRDGYIPVGVDGRADGCFPPPPAAADTISLARCTKPDLYKYYFILFYKRTVGYIADN